MHPRRSLTLAATAAVLALACGGCASSGSSSRSVSAAVSAAAAAVSAAPTAAPGPLGASAASGTASPAAGASGAGTAAVTSAPVHVAHTTMGTVGYRRVGSGPPMLLIMGFGGTLDSWSPSFVAALAKTHTVVTFDNAGIGQTAALPAPQTMTAMAQQSAALLTSLHLTGVDVLGWSLGGMVAQALTVEHPALVSHLVLAATLPGDGHATSPSAAVVAQLTASASNPSLILPLLFPANAGESETDYVTGIYSWPNVESVPPAAFAAEGTALQSWSSGKEEVGHGLSGVTVPTLIADGDSDVLIPPANVTALKTAIRGSQSVVYPGTGHAFLFQDQAQFLARVATLISG